MNDKKGDFQLVKDVNKGLILGVIERQYVMSRAEIARITGLSPTTVSTLTAELVRDGFVIELGSGPSRKGRRPIMYQLNRGACYIVGADVGSHDLTVVITDLTTNVVLETQANIAALTGQDLVRVLRKSIAEAIAQSGLERGKFIGIGIASPGLVDSGRGVVIRASNVQWKNLPLKGILEHELGLPVYVENNNYAAALGEYNRGFARPVKSFLYLNVGRGVGAGIIIDGHTLHGSGLSAGEIGHLVMDPKGERCVCGSRGCLETLVSAGAIEQRARRLAEQFPQSLLAKLTRNDPAKLTLDTIVAAAEQQDTSAMNVLTEAGEWIGLALAGMINIINPGVIMLGGRVIRTTGEILLNIARNVARDCAQAPFFEMAAFYMPRLGHLSSALGAVGFVMQEELHQSSFEIRSSGVVSEHGVSRRQNNEAEQGG